MSNREFPSLDIKVVNPGLRYGTLRKNERTLAKGDNLVFCYAGSLNPHKGVHVLIDAFKTVCSKDARLRIYGSVTDSSYVSRVKSMAEGDRRIEFSGVYNEDQVGEILRSIDVVIIPSLWYETYCLVMHESFACNVPQIASDVGVFADKIVDRQNSFLFRMGDSQHLSEIIQNIADNPIILNGIKRGIEQMVIPGIEQEAYTYNRMYTQISL